MQSSCRDWDRRHFHVAVRAILSLVGLVVGVLGSSNESAAQSSTPPAPRVLFDAWHANTWIRQLPSPRLYNYHQLSGPARAAMTLEMMGWVCESHVEPWTKDNLRDVPLVVMNLVSADRPPFLLSEIQALNDYLHQGGGIIVITDHTNCYFHNTVLSPWFHELDIQLTNHSACDQTPYTISKGNAWINIESFSDHPVTRGLKNVAFQTGGSVDPRYAIAWTSPNGWGDDGIMSPYGESGRLGFSGDLSMSPAETVGPIPVIAAKQIGQGRLVIIADQNCIGGLFLNYADNRQLWIQATLWASQREADPNVEALIQKGMQPEPKRTQIWCLEPLQTRSYYWGSMEEGKLGNAYALLSKFADARATDKPPANAEWLILPSVDLLAHPSYQNPILEHLQRPHRRLVILGTSEEEQIVLKWVADRKATSYPLANKSIRQAWMTENECRIYWIAERQLWENQQVASPTLLRSEKEANQDEQLLEWMWAEGLQKIAGFNDHIPWDDE